MKGCVIHNEHGLWLGPFPTVLEKLLDKILKDGCVSWTLEHSRQNNAVLRIRRHNLITLITMKFRHLNRCGTKGRPTHSPEAYPFITSRFIHIDKVVRLEVWDKMIVFVSKVKVAFSSLDLSSLFWLVLGLKGATDARFRCLKSEFVLQKKHYLLQI